MRRTLVSGLLLAAVAGCTVVNPKPLVDDKAALSKQVTPPPAAVVGWQPPAGSPGVPVKPAGPLAAGPVGTPLPPLSTTPTPQTPFAVKQPLPAAPPSALSQVTPAVPPSAFGQGPPAMPPSAFGQGTPAQPAGTTTQLATNYQPPPSYRPPVGFQPPTPSKAPQPTGAYPPAPPEPLTQVGYSSEVRSDDQGLTATTLPPLKEMPPPAPREGQSTPLPPLPTSVTAEHPPAPEAPPTTVVSAPAMRMVNSKRFTLNYEIKDGGSGGPPPVDLWCTTDMRQWKKWDAQPQGTHSYVVEVKEEGTYGFTLVARTAGQPAARPPVPGDTPQVWVTVDATKPAVQMTGLELSLTAKVPSLIVRWTARDKNFGPRPVTLAYAAQPEGPWTLIAQNVENNGRFEWALPANMPTAMYVRIEAADLVGNTGIAVTPNPIPINANWVSATAPTPPPAPEAKAPILLRPPAEPVTPTASIVNVDVSAAQASPKD